jgi:hypothetical protein
MREMLMKSTSKLMMKASVLFRSWAMLLTSL